MQTKFVDYANPNNSLNSCDIVMLDTCVMFNLASSNRDANVTNFAKFALNNDIMFCYSYKSVEEINIKSQYTTIPRNKRTALPQIGKYVADSFNKSEAILNVVNTLPNVYNEPVGSVDADILEKIRNNSLKHNLRWGDAAIYTIAKENGINYIWTMDSDLSRIVDSDMTIITDAKFIPNNITSSSSVKVNSPNASLINTV